MKIQIVIVFVTIFVNRKELRSRASELSLSPAEKPELNFILESFEKKNIYTAT